MPYYNQTTISIANFIRYYFILYDLQFALFNFILFASDNLMPFTFTVALWSFSSFAAYGVHVGTVYVILPISTSNALPCIQFATKIAGVLECFQLFFHFVCAMFDICLPLHMVFFPRSMRNITYRIYSYYVDEEKWILNNSKLRHIKYTTIWNLF